MGENKKGILANVGLPVVRSYGNVSLKLKRTDRLGRL